MNSKCLKRVAKAMEKHRSKRKRGSEESLIECVRKIQTKLETVKIKRTIEQLLFLAIQYSKLCFF